MKVVKFVPSLCKGEEAVFSGFVSLSMPSFEQKFEYLEKLNIKSSEDGEVDLGSTMQKLRYMREMVAMSKPHYMHVEIVNKATGEKFASYEDLSFDPDAHPILIEVASQILQGFKVGNG